MHICILYIFIYWFSYNIAQKGRENSLSRWKKKKKHIQKEMRCILSLQHPVAEERKKRKSLGRQCGVISCHTCLMIYAWRHQDGAFRRVQSYWCLYLILVLVSLPEPMTKVKWYKIMRAFVII